MKTKTEKQTRWTTWQDLSQLSEVIEMTNLDVKKNNTNKKFTARQMIDRLHEIDRHLYEKVLDAISDSYVGMSGCWKDDEDGNMILLTETRTVVCADCGETCPEFLESEATRMPDHDGIWADCSECGVTGVE